MTKHKVMSVRWSASEWALLKERAERASVSLSDYVRDRCLLRIGIKRVRDDDLLIHRLSQLTVALESVREGLTDETGDLARRVDEAMSSLQPALEALTDP